MRLHKGLVAAAAITATMLVGQYSFADDTWMEEPEETTTEYVGPDSGLFFGGLLLFGAPYVASAIVASNSTHPGDGKLYIPVAGPWLDLGQRPGCASTNQMCMANEGTNQVLLIGNGVLQGIGALTFLASFLSPETEQVPASVARLHKSHKMDSVAKTKPTIHFTPASFPGGGQGLAAFGTF